MRKINYLINGDQMLSISIEGDSAWGEGGALVNQDDNLIAGTHWEKIGHTVTSLTECVDVELLKNRIEQIVHQELTEALGRDLPYFSLERYHDFCDSDIAHVKVAKRLSHGLPLDELPFSYRLLDEVVGGVCGKRVSCVSNFLPQANRFCIRIVRPGVLTDNNPPHRDVWLDHLRNAVNIYIPVTGSSDLSSLPMVSESHLWDESSIERTLPDTKVNGVNYSVSCVVGSEHDISLIRPPVKYDEVLVFSPYLIHGGGINLSSDITRVSLEMRFWRL